MALPQILMPYNTAAETKVSERECDPPAYAEGVLLYPTTADASTRYSRKFPLVQSTEFTIPPILHANLLSFTSDHDADEKSTSMMPVPSAPPNPWTQHLHPEGATYFVNGLINVVTDSNILKLDIYRAVMEGVGLVQNLATNLQVKLAADTELYIRTDEPDSCHYYLVNHGARVEFWLNDNKLSDLGFSRVVSMSHLKFVLEEHYWTHVEYFPHRLIPKQLLRDLVSVLRHGQLDHETSRSSTFPFDADQCKKFIKLLSVDDEDTQNPYYICMAARIWTSICKHRFDNMYGEEFARLDRYSRRREELVEHDPFYMKVASTLVFGYNRGITKKLDDLYVDETTYTMHWRRFITSMYDSWRDSRLMSICLLIISAILISYPHGILSYYVGLVAIAVSTLSLVSSLALLHKFQEKLQLVAVDAVSFLSDEKHDKLEFQPLGLLMSTPGAFATWSLVFFITQVFSIIVESTGAPLLYTVIIVFGALACVLLMVVVKYTAATLLDIWRRRRRQYGCPV